MSALDVIRLFLHVLSATVWVGGQITVAGLLPTLRALGTEAPKAVAQGFRRIAWPAFGVLVLTGIWNVLAEKPSEFNRGVLTAKVVAVVASGAAAYLHERASSRRGLAVWGAVSFLAALTAVLLGVILGGEAG